MTGSPDSSGVMGQRPDGTWEPVKPLGPQGIVATAEFWLRAHGVPLIPRLLAWWDERGLR